MNPRESLSKRVYIATIAYAMGCGPDRPPGNPFRMSVPLKRSLERISGGRMIGPLLLRTSVDHGTAFDIAWQGRPMRAAGLRR
jgi:hypothetical protein